MAKRSEKHDPWLCSGVMSLMYWGREGLVLPYQILLGDRECRLPDGEARVLHEVKVPMGTRRCVGRLGENDAECGDLVAQLPGA